MAAVSAVAAAPVIAQVVMDANSTTTIINNLNTLYSNAFSQLISYTVGLVALVGIAIPAIVAMIQQRSLKGEKESLEKAILDEIGQAKESIRDDLKTEIKHLIEVEEVALVSRLEAKFEDLERKIACAEAGTFFVQANSQIDSGKPANAAGGYCIAIRGFYRGQDELNGQRALSRLIDDCLPKINKKQYESFDIEEKMNKLKTFLQENNTNNRHSDSIKKINSAVKKIQTRESAPSEQ